MKENREIHIRDPFILTEDGKYYMYGTRGANFGQGTGGFDVYVGTDLCRWSDPVQVFDSDAYGMNAAANWAPEVHKFIGKYYLFATFEQKNGMRGTYALVSDAPTGPFRPASKEALTPHDWWSLDGTLFVDEAQKPWLVFCHEHVQILNGTVCCVPLLPDMSAPAGEPVLLFAGWDAYGAEKREGERYVTDGPFLYRGKNGRLYMMWSTCMNSRYYQCLAVSETGAVTGPWRQLPPIFTEDGGHGMLFRTFDGKLMLTLHTPNCQPDERPAFYEMEDTGETLRIRR